MGRELGGCAFFVGELGPHLTPCAWAEAYLPTKWHLDPSSHLATIDIGRNIGGGSSVPLISAPFLGMGPHLHKVAWAEAYLHTK